MTKGLKQEQKLELNDAEKQKIIKLEGWVGGEEMANSNKKTNKQWQTMWPSPPHSTH